MNAHAAPALTVRSADLRDAQEVRRLDAFVHEHPDSEVFHRPQWSRAVERGCRQRSHYLVAEDGAGAIAGCLPLTEVRSVLFGNALVSAGFGTGGGILAATDAAASALASSAWALAERRRCPSAELRGGPVPEGWSAKQGVYAAFAADLAADDDAMLNGIPRRQRAEVRKALALGLETSSGSDRRHLDAFRRCYGESVRNLGTPVFPSSLFAAMAEEFGEDSDAVVVWKDGKPLSAHFNFYFKGTAVTYWGGGVREARAVRGNDLVYYAFMRHAVARGCGRADFGRSKLGTGACARKRIWGFEERPLVYATRAAEGAEARDINPTSAKYSRRTELWAKLPLPVANALGPFIARGLG